jgi:hypothetical protein
MDSLHAVVEEVIEARFFDAVEARTAPSTPADAGGETITKKYLEPDAMPEDSAVLEDIREGTDSTSPAEDYPPDVAPSHPTEQTEHAEDSTVEPDNGDAGVTANETGDSDTGAPEETVPSEKSDGENDSQPADTSDT